MHGIARPVTVTALWVATIAVMVAAVVGPRAAGPAIPDAAVVTAGPVLVSSRPASHDQDGQNVLFVDRQIPYPNPFAGTAHENIFAGRRGAATAAAGDHGTADDVYGLVDAVCYPTTR